MTPTEEELKSKLRGERSARTHLYNRTYTLVEFLEANPPRFRTTRKRRYEKLVQRVNNLFTRR